MEPIPQPGPRRLAIFDLDGTLSRHDTYIPFVLGLLLPLSSSQYEGLGRYCSVLFPLPILLGSLPGATRHHGLMMGFAIVYALGLILFGNVHPLF